MNYTTWEEAIKQADCLWRGMRCQCIEPLSKCRMDDTNAECATAWR